MSKIITGEKGPLIDDADEIAKNYEAKLRREAKKKIEYQKEYEEQLEAFRKNEKYFNDYPEDIKKDNYVLLRFFKHVPERRFWKSMSLYAPVTRNSFSGNHVTTEKVDVDYNITNIAKVIKVGPKSKYKKGDIVLLPYEKVQGVVENPKWIDYKNSQKMAGATPIEPDDTRKVIPAIEINYSQYAYKKPKNADMDEEDRVTFCILDYEIVSGE